MSVPEFIRYCGLTTEDFFEHTMCKSGWIVEARHKFLQFHLGHLLQIWCKLRFMKCACNDHWNDQFTFVIRQSSVQETADIRSSYRLTD